MPRRFFAPRNLPGSAVRRAGGGDIPHPSPRRLLFVYLEGTSEITAGDGEARLFDPGSVLLAEDTWGSGHSSRVVEPGIGLVFSIADETGDTDGRA
jgi:hypothetical protein